MPKLTGRGSAPAQTIHIKRYDRFRGVDFSTDPSQVDDRRSPWAPNLVADESGYPEKRVGWRVLHRLEAPINGIFFYQKDGQTVTLCHGGTKLYAWRDGETPKAVRSGLKNARSAGFPFGGKFYLLTGREYLAYDGETCREAGESAYVPITAVPKDKDTQERYQPVNLLTRLRKNLFVGDGSRTQFALDGQDVQHVTVTVDGAAQTGFTCDKAKGTIVFSQAPAAGTPAGTPNITVQFEAGEDQRAKVTGCTVAALYGGRVFLSGNPAYPGADWHSELDVQGLDAAAYIPDTSYAQVGADSARIMGYLRAGDALAILKEDNGQDASVFLRTVEHTSQGDLFPVRQGVAGAGAVSPHCCLSLLDDPLFLTKRGVYALASQQIGLERTLQPRSQLVNARLTKGGLDQAYAAVWNGFYVLCVDGEAYLADSRQRDYRQDGQTFGYEWYHWTNIPARVLAERDGTLYFGAVDGRVCRLNDDMRKGGQLQMSAYNDSGAPVVAEWATKLDDDGDYMRRKTMLRRGSGVALKTYLRSGVKVLVRTDEDFGREAARGDASTFDFSDLDFTDFSLNTLPQNILPLNAKVKRYRMMQFICRNDALNQGFGVYGVEKRYVFSRDVK